MKKSKAAVILVAILAAFAGLDYYASIILSSTGIGEEMSIPLGLDLSGGVSITYQVMDENPSAEDMSDTIYKLQKRVESYSTEASVYQVGDDRIAVEIPGVTDASKILEELGNPGSLEFQLSDGTVFMTGDQVADAQAATTTDQYGNKQYVVQLTLTDEGAKTFGEVTSENVGKALPIVYDGEVISYPTVQEAITGGTAQISGQSTFEEAQTLATQIRIGSLSLQLSELESSVVGAQLGSQAISSSLKAAAIGLVIVMVFMIIVYAVPGVAAALALAIYTALVIATLYLFEITLTLPGIAGIILSIGMAVDANVIIFARIREEIASGKSVITAMKNGFHKAMSARMAGVSQGTASNVLNGKGNVSSEKIKAVEEAAKKLGYTINERAKMLRKGSGNIICVIVPSMERRHYRDFYYCLKSYAEKRGYTAELLITNDNRQTEYSMIQWAKSVMAMGVASITCLGEKEVKEAYAGFEKLCFVERKATDDLDYIGFDYESAGGQIAETVISARYHNVLVVTDSLKFSNENEFCRGLYKMLAQEKIKFFHITTDSRRVSHAIINTLVQENEYDAIITTNIRFAEKIRNVVTNFSAGNQTPIFTLSPITSLPEKDYRKYELNYGLVGKMAAEKIIGDSKENGAAVPDRFYRGRIVRR